MSDFRQRLARLHKGIAALEPKIDPAKGFAARSANIDLQIAKLFEEFLAWELDHPQVMKEALVHNETFPGYGGGKPVKDADAIMAREAEPRYQFHIDQELTGASKLVERAVETIERGDERPATPATDWRGMEYRDRYFRVGDRPVFTAGFNFFGVDQSRFDSLLQTMRSLGVGVISVSVSIPSMLKEGGSVDAGKIQKTVDSVCRLGRMGFKVDVHLSWPKNEKVLEKLWPGITKHDANFFGLDIDHPGIEEMILRVMPELMPKLKDLDEIVSWDMANEPFFVIEKWGPHSLRKYRAWLADRYGAAESLNEAWDSEYTSFDSVPHPNEVPRAECSAGEWHDRVTFNSTRVASFFGLVSGEIWRYVPDAPVHLKGQDNNSLGPMPDCPADGIDREMLARVTSLQGLDTRPLPVTERRMAARSDDPVMSYDGSGYGLHWLGQSFLYDYLTSLQPEQPVVDWEYHAFSINAIRVPDINPDHARAVLWLAHLHGLIGNATWYWHHRGGGDPFSTHYLKLWFYGSISTQPLLTAGYFHTMLELNSFSREVEVLATQAERPVWLLVSKPSYNQNTAHINALHRAYEGLCFHGLRVGFVTERMIIDGGIPDDCRVIVLSDIEYMDARAIGALRKACGDGLSLVVFGSKKPSLDPWGKPHASKLVSFLAEARVLDYAAAHGLSARFRDILSGLTEGLPLSVNVVGSDDAFGVMHAMARVNGDLVLLMVNVASRPVTVEVRDRDKAPLRGYDELACEVVDGSAIDLPLLGVRLLSGLKRGP